MNEAIKHLERSYELELFLVDLKHHIKIMEIVGKDKAEIVDEVLTKIENKLNYEKR